jgi:hypothetical protein
VPIAVPSRTPFIGLAIARPTTKPARMKMVRKHPPARVARVGIGRPCQSGRSCERRRLMVNALLTMVVLSPETAVRIGRGMDIPFIHGRAALSDAAELMHRYGENAALEARTRAERSRDDGNVVRFCHWRQIQRVIASLSNEEVRGTVH